MGEPVSEAEPWLQNAVCQIPYCQLFGILLVITVVAYFLQIFYIKIVKIYEGYWPIRLRQWYIKYMCINFSMKCTQQKFKSLVDKMNEEAARENWENYSLLKERKYYEYPNKIDCLLPTKLGNVFRATEDYPKTKYDMNIVFWWPKLWNVLPECTRKEINETILSMIALLNFATLLGLISIFVFIYLGLIKHNIMWQLWMILVFGIFLSYLSYLGAVSQAVNYGILFRSAVDLYRFELLKAMHQPLPENSDSEKELWNKLFNHLYYIKRDLKFDYEHR
jgi:hypothetical protein